jgi:peptidoglycan/xylan/chitin deacetylase (PgdA/CDA1 family)
MSPDLLLKAASIIPMTWVRALSGVSLVIPFYHMVSDDHVPHVSNLYRFRSVEEFKSDLEFFALHFKFVALEDIVNALNGSRHLPRFCCHLTFDDGFREMYDVVAPILHEAGVPATFFVNTAFLDCGGLAHYNVISALIDRIGSKPSALSDLETTLDSVLPSTTASSFTPRQRLLSIGYPNRGMISEIARRLGFDLGEYVSTIRPIMSSDEVRQLAKKGFSVGSHGHDHLLYRDLTLTEQLSQTQVSVEILRERLGLKARSFAFPHNDDGVQFPFFESIFTDRLVDICFGTSGLISHFHPKNLQRISMEKTSARAEDILSLQFTRAMSRGFIRR